MRALVAVVALTGCLAAPQVHLASPETAAPRLAEGAATRCEGDEDGLSCRSRAWTQTARATHVVETEVRLEGRSAILATTPPPLARHPRAAAALGPPACALRREGCTFALRYGLGGSPARWRLSAPRGFAIAMRHAAYGDDAQLVAVLSKPPTSASPGGPFVDVGARWSADPRGGSRPRGAVRLGWEAFAPTLVAHAVAFDTDGERWRSAYTAELVSPAWLVLPSVGIGVGLPVQFAPTVATGVRIQTSVVQGPVGLVAWTDWMPSLVDPWLATAALRGTW